MEQVQEGLEAAIRAAVVSGSQHPDTDLANAWRIQTHYADRLLYVEGIGWHVFERGGPWRHEPHRAREIATGISRKIALEIAAVADLHRYFSDKESRGKIQEVADNLASWSRVSEFSTRIAAALSLAEPMLFLKASKLDANPDLLGLADGVLDLRTFHHRPHQQGDYITKVAGCGYDATATAPIWVAFIAEILGDDPDLVDYVQRLVGYMLAGHRGEHLLLIFWGSGANGKSTLLGALQVMLGDYAGSAAPDLLIQRNGSEHPTAIADLQGKRLVVVSESGEAGRLNEERCKWLTGGDTLTARRMRQDFYNFTPTHQLVLQTNHRPKATGTDEGLWRRVRLIPFAVTVPVERRDPTLPDKLKTEMPGILAWTVEGLKRYRAEGFRVPKAVTAATSTYRDESDQLAAFLAECCVIDPRCTATSQLLFTTYTRWCEATGERPRSQRDFGVRMAERGFEAFRGHAGSRRWRGIGVADGDAGDTGDGPLPISGQMDPSYGAYTERCVTHVTSVTKSTVPAISYRATKDPG